MDLLEQVSVLCARKQWQQDCGNGRDLFSGKTRLAQAVSGEIEATFYCVSSSDLISSWVGESEK